jgi:hypothetical protein
MANGCNIGLIGLKRATLAERDGDTGTPLYSTALNGHLEIVKFLIDQ